MEKRVTFQGMVRKYKYTSRALVAFPQDGIDNFDLEKRPNEDTETMWIGSCPRARGIGSADRTSSPSTSGFAAGRANATVAGVATVAKGSATSGTTRKSPTKT